MFGFSTSPVKVLKRMRNSNLILALLGIAVSAYTIFVDYKKSSDKDYVAYCDINESMSCSSILTSRYGRGFGVLGLVLGEDNPLVLPNGVYGIIFYLIIIGLGELMSTNTAIAQKYIAASSNILSVYLGYILFYVLRNICVVCITTYVINFMITVFCCTRVSQLNAIRNKKKPTSKRKKN